MGGGCVTIRSMLWVKLAVVALAPVIWWVLEAAAYTFVRIPRIREITTQPSELRGAPQVLRQRPSSRLLAARHAMASCATALRSRPIERLNGMFGGWEPELQWRRCALRSWHDASSSLISRCELQEKSATIATSAMSQQQPPPPLLPPVMHLLPVAMRRHVNTQAAGVDRIGWLFNAIAYSLMIVLRHWLRQGQPGEQGLANIAEWAGCLRSWATEAHSKGCSHGRYALLAAALFMPPMPSCTQAWRWRQARSQCWLECWRPSLRIAAGAGASTSHGGRRCLWRPCCTCSGACAC